MNTTIRTYINAAGQKADKRNRRQTLVAILAIFLLALAFAELAVLEPGAASFAALRFGSKVAFAMAFAWRLDFCARNPFWALCVFIPFGLCGLFIWTLISKQKTRDEHGETAIACPG